MSFVRDKGNGDKAEKLILDLLNKLKISTIKNDSKIRKNLSLWDIQFNYNGTNYTAEIKYDLYEAKSGNIAIEFYNPNSCKPSGIYASNADFWITVLKDESAWITKRADLIKYCEETPADRTIANAGDGNASIYLYARDNIFPAIYQRFDKDTLKCLKKLLLN